MNSYHVAPTRYGHGDDLISEADQEDVPVTAVFASYHEPLMLLVRDDTPWFD